MKKAVVFLADGLEEIEGLTAVSYTHLFLGMGIQPPTPSWGSMISFAQSYISYMPTYSIFPGIAIMITVIAFNIFGYGLRDALDPKMKNQ